MVKSNLLLILASQSPRRAELLAKAGYEFTVIEPDAETEERAEKNFPPEELVVRLANCKAENVVRQLQLGRPLPPRDADRRSMRPIVLAADTVAVCQGEVLGKPADRDDAMRMLKLMRGDRHQVLTGVCLWDPATDRRLERLSITTLKMDFLEDDRIELFLQSEDWRGKAGGFGYQDDLDWLHIVEGLESNVVGLPVEQLPLWMRELLS